MAKIIDISGKITNELPMMKITNDILVTVNNRKSVILNIQAMALEVEKKAKNSNDSTYDQLAFMQKALGMLVGEKNAKAIDDLDLPMPEFRKVYESIMAVASGTYEDGGDNTPTSKQRDIL